MTKSTDAINLSELIDLLVYQTEKYLQLTSKVSSKREMDACNEVLAVLLKEYEKRQEYLTNYN